MLARSRVCAGWAGCHDADNLLSVRIAVFEGRLTPEIAQAVIGYSCPIPLFDSGEEAAEHGMAQIEAPSSDAIQTIRKIVVRRTDRG